MSGAPTCMSSASSSSSYRLLYFLRFRASARSASSLSRLGGRGRQRNWKKRSRGSLQARGGRGPGAGAVVGRAGREGMRLNAALCLRQL